MQKKITISKEIIKSRLADKNTSLFIYDSTDSTNNIAKELARDNSSEAVIIALHQTAGRGRRGRSFYSPDGCGIYMSLLLHTGKKATDVSLITSAAAAAVAESIEEICQVKTGIKWINDVYIGQKKVCGILCESFFCNNSTIPEYTVVGIGINIIAPDGFPYEIENIATSVYGADLPDEDIVSVLCAAIINRMKKYESELENRTFLKKYKEKMIMLGKNITVHSQSGCYNAVALDVDDNCHLKVKLEDGSVQFLSFGEITTRIDE